MRRRLGAAGQVLDGFADIAGVALGLFLSRRESADFRRGLIRRVLQALGLTLELLELLGVKLREPLGALDRDVVEVVPGLPADERRELLLDFFELLCELLELPPLGLAQLA